MNLRQTMQVASILTLRNRISKVPIPKILVVDECQHLVSHTWKEVADYYSEQGTIILGLSATPKRLSGESLKECFDVMVQGPLIKELIDTYYRDSREIIEKLTSLIFGIDGLSSMRKR
ncbi:superfamily II DNA or RNA helicase [Sporomusaceae bacterium BoRhaA]|uniref:DEAD/DEAH box helicase family protein n=1 Tax=Pelorhabdus rhamnosifermentans TaxID=2772457 RepID=UPI001C06494D|nr:DEAD/DEAH box helicase family protein [Pelorhabdus rhamnosifermentans]MBU2704117.1 superfamily II DNA or RNA helicase [Pelorhabdus rhamnosifermentans]